jgi:hypothetical protein
MARFRFYSSRDSSPATTSIPTLRPIQFLVTRELEAFPLGLKWLEKEAHHLFPSTAKSKNAWIGE